MRERRIVSEEEYFLNLVIKVIENLCIIYKKNLEDVDCIIVVIIIVDYVFFSVVC